MRLRTCAIRFIAGIGLAAALGGCDCMTVRTYQVELKSNANLRAVSPAIANGFVKSGLREFGELPHVAYRGKFENYPGLFSDVTATADYDKASQQMMLRVSEFPNCGFSPQLQKVVDQTRQALWDTGVVREIRESK